LHQETFSLSIAGIEVLIRVKDRTQQFEVLPRNPKEVVMPVDSILASAAVVSVFLIFTGGSGAISARNRRDTNRPAVIADAAASDHAHRPTELRPGIRSLLSALTEDALARRRAFRLDEISLTAC
jgi:hypothetical protein